ncbi:hypothetical protein EVAR_67924_1 [Eumeta japonica]|uniref:Uncharacterized protein n=1 Tax=Eumeta variegata TaxID=151549 RepID=A0A4C1ZMY2_EUMVA|nr:hypothetical protein EVAR_67924_1 [Eumeta japonica]
MAIIGNGVRVLRSMRIMYISVIAPIVLYASCAWAPATRKLGVRRMLDASESSGLVIRGEARKGFGRHFCRPEARETRVYFGDLPYPAQVPGIGYESVEDLEYQITDRLAVVGLQIYTDGSRIEGKVGAVLTEWRDGEET